MEAPRAPGRAPGRRVRAEEDDIERVIAQRVEKDAQIGILAARCEAQQLRVATLR
jgi:hypothetical protein